MAEQVTLDENMINMIVAEVLRQKRGIDEKKSGSGLKQNADIVRPNYQRQKHLRKKSNRSEERKTADIIVTDIDSEKDINGLQNNLGIKNFAEAEEVQNVLARMMLNRVK